MDRLKKQSEKDAADFELSPITDTAYINEDELAALLTRIRCRERATWPQLKKNPPVLFPGKTGDAFWDRAINAERNSLRTQQAH